MADLITVYVVDDDPSARVGLARLLRAAGYQVRTFGSADELLEALDAAMTSGSELPGCMVLDARMPGLSGEDLAAELKARDCLPPIIVVTADDDVATRQRSLKMNAVGFFRKPIDGSALIDAIGWALQAQGGTAAMMTIAFTLTSTIFI